MKKETGNKWLTYSIFTFIYKLKNSGYKKNEKKCAFVRTQAQKKSACTFPTSCNGQNAALK